VVSYTNGRSVKYTSLYDTPMFRRPRRRPDGSAEIPAPKPRPLTYPGSKVPAADDEPAGNSRGGTDPEHHRIGELAAVLDRSVFTTRRWLNDGILPEVPRSTGGQRVFTAVYLETVSRIAEAEGIIGPRPRPKVSTTRFAERVRSALDVASGAIPFLKVSGGSRYP